MITSLVRVTLECDHEPALCLRQPTVIAAPSHFDALNIAARDGWYLAGKRCLCPKHAAERTAALLEANRLQAKAS